MCNIIQIKRKEENKKNGVVNEIYQSSEITKVLSFVRIYFPDTIPTCPSTRR